MALPPPTPAYIFRGHNAPIHSVAFIRTNTRLVTGDAEGWIVVWNLDLRRPVAVWRAHEGSVLGVGEWGARRLVT
jgi:WD40 repeat protein